MKMRKKYQKKIIILKNSQNSIKKYKNLQLYKAFNNYNLKFFLFFLEKKQKHYKNISKGKYLFNSLLKKNKGVLFNRLFFFKHSFYLITNKDLFFQSSKQNKNTDTITYTKIFKNKLTLNKKERKYNTPIYFSTNIQYIDYKKKISSIDVKLQKFKLLFTITFLINLLKVYETYKVLVLLLYLNSK